MLKMNCRQEQILNGLIQEYIVSAQPVSSQSLKEKRDFQFCSATVRNELQKLTEEGYLEQPHASAGRVPTDKAYRFFVDSLAKTEFDKDIFVQFQEMIEESKDVLRTAQLLVQKLSSISLGLTATYLVGNNLFLKEGWKEVFQEPEFKDRDYGLKFLKLVGELEKQIANFGPDENESLSIYIGRENPIVKSDDFSMLISPCCFCEDKQGLLLILGPKRMAYDKNISLINSVNRLLESL